MMRVLFRVVLGGGDETTGTVLFVAARGAAAGPGAGPPAVRAGHPGGAAGRALRRHATGAPSSSASAPPTRSPTPSGCSVRCPRHCTRSAPPWSSRSRCSRSSPTALAGCARAQSLRAGDARRVGRLRRYLVPVLEDALERSLRLAAGMDTRGYGRSAGATVRRAVAHRGPAARRAVRDLCRGLRRPRPHRATPARHADAGPGRRGRGRRPGRRRSPGAPDRLPARPVARGRAVVVMARGCRCRPSRCGGWPGTRCSSPTRA